jgi:hypothetical protein
LQAKRKFRVIKKEIIFLGVETLIIMNISDRTFSKFSDVLFANYE